MDINLLNSLSLDILHTGYAKLDNKWRFSNVISPFSRLFYISSGNAIMNHTNQLFNLQPGYMYLIPSFTVNSYHCPNYHEQYYVSFFESFDERSSIYDTILFKYKVKANNSDVDLFKRLSEINSDKTVTDSRPKSHINKSLSNIEKNNKPNHYIETQGILSILLSRFIKNKKRATNSVTKSKGLDEVISFIKMNLDKDLSIRKLANDYGFSEDHFSRRFLQNFGIRPNKYIQLKRIQQAQLLLVTTNYSLKQIALNVGMENLSYFSRTFKKNTGNTPANFRKQHLKI